MERMRIIMNLRQRRYGSITSIKTFFPENDKDNIIYKHGMDVDQ